MKRVAIVGGGISGLSTAFYLERAKRDGAPISYTLFEAGASLGGVMRTDREQGCLIEAGPDSFLSLKPWATELAREAGLGDQLIGSNDSARKTYIVVRNRLIPMPDGLMMMVPTQLLPTLLSPLFSIGTKLRFATELLYRPQNNAGDESAAAFVARHYGGEVVDRLADPLLAGVYGGDASRLSARAVLPNFVAMEKSHGSLSRATLAAKMKRKPTGAPQPMFTSLYDGMQQLVDSVLRHLDRDAIRLNTPVTRLEPQSGGWDVVTFAGAQRFDAVVLGAPAYVDARLLAPIHPRLGELLAGINYASSTTVALGYDRAAVEAAGGLPPGFGFLVPKSENRQVLACTFVHNKFPHRAPPDKLLLRVFLGGAAGTAPSSYDDEVVAQVRHEVAELLHLKVEPLFARVYRWQDAMAQYEVGHLDRVAEIDQRARELPPLHLIGNALRGIGVPDCVRSGKEAAQAILASAQ